MNIIKASKREQFKIDLSNTMCQFNSLMSSDEMLKKYQWFSIASAIHDEALTLELMKEIIKESMHLHYIKQKAK